MFAYAAPWFIYGGFNLAGSWLIKLVGMKPAVQLVSPWVNTGFVGGLIMGVGAMLVPGCNIGGFFSAIASLSLSGFILQRAGFCFTASFRDLFTSGDGRLAKGVILAIGVAMPGFAILQGLGCINREK